MHLLQTVALLVVVSTTVCSFGNIENMLLSRTVREADKHHKEREGEFSCLSKLYPMKEKEFSGHHSYTNFSTCYAYCLFNKSDLITTSGNISVTAAIDRTVQIMNLTDENILGNMTAICGSGKHVNTTTHNNHTYACSAAPLRFIVCVYDIVNLYCPTAQQIQSEHCKTQLEITKKKYQ
ncbi:hypothetical protein L9F63_017268 [Diploptera punctata]|uniref:Uncharacterized protein n=1 Tax=Diploptera punctata TaxID=6984 RepID=A0AAD7ZZ31_DIPPU|nr:hypothetical protein L9F63_017268 [Diploptera punctata]